MSYLRRYPPQGGRSGHLHHLTLSQLPPDGPALAALLWSNGITAVADLRPEPDPELKEQVEQYGVAYGHIPDEQLTARLRRAEQLYHTLAITDDNRTPETAIPCDSLPCGAGAPQPDGEASPSAPGRAGPDDK